MPRSLQVSVVSDAAKILISSTNWAVLKNLKAIDGNSGPDIAFVGLDTFKTGSHCLQTTANDESHYATIFLLLPTFTDSADICVRATHDSVVSQVKLPKDLSETACAVGVYAGVSNAHIEVGAGGEVICLTYHASLVVVGSCDEPRVIPTLQYLSGALPPLRDGFCLWRHMLNDASVFSPALMLFFLESHPESVKDFSGDDATLLCHLAPLAKAYGFKINTLLCKALEVHPSGSGIMKYRVPRGPGKGMHLRRHVTERVTVLWDSTVGCTGYRTVIPTKTSHGLCGIRTHGQYVLLREPAAREHPSQAAWLPLPHAAVYKEYFGLSCEVEFDPSVLYMPKKAHVDYEWEELRPLGGVPVSAVQQGLLKLATRLVKTDGYLKDALAEIDVEEDHEFEDDSLYYATVRYTHTRTVSVLFIAP
ncbi:hypothetical protein B0H12DRAFT_1079267 [Mycena haematopus]|nr:hypothetical protein B0H12DRAFT_1079267 [Mycena haematopus]